MRLPTLRVTIVFSCVQLCSDRAPHQRVSVMESGQPGLTEDDMRENKERRRRERRERRARRQRQRESDLVHQLDGYCYEGGPAGCLPYGDHLPDLLNSHVPPPAYTTAPTVVVPPTGPIGWG